MNTVNTQLVSCDEQELVNGANIAENLRERIAILFPAFPERTCFSVGNGGNSAGRADGPSSAASMRSIDPGDWTFLNEQRKDAAASLESPVKGGRK